MNYRVTLRIGMDFRHVAVMYCADTIEAVVRTQRWCRSLVASGQDDMRDSKIAMYRPLHEMDAYQYEI